MTGLSNAQLNRNGTSTSVTRVYGDMQLVAQPSEKARVAVIPLFCPSSASASFKDPSVGQILIVTVELNPARVLRQWLLDPAEAANNLGPKPIKPCGRNSDSQSNRASAYDSVQYHLPRATLNEFTDTHGLARVSVEHGEAPFVCDVLTRLTYLMLARLDSPELFSAAFMDHFVMLFCSHVVHLRTAGLPNQAIRQGGLSAWHKRRVLEILSKNADAKVKLSAVAKECGLSVSHFARSFKTSFGMPVHRWVIRHRVARAKELLLGSNESLVDVAFQAGFCDQASFNRTFAKLTGTSPGRWRREYRN